MIEELIDLLVKKEVITRSEAFTLYMRAGRGCENLARRFRENPPIYNGELFKNAKRLQDE